MNILRTGLLAVGITVFTLVTGQPIAAQSIDDIVPDFTPEEASDLGKAFGQYTSATVVFTGRNAASTGSFSFDDDAGDFSVTSLPFAYRTGEKEDTLRFVAHGALGRFESRSSIDDFALLSQELGLDPNQNIPDFRKDEATTLTVGGGVVYQPIEGLRITPAFDILWTHVKRRFDYNNFVSALIGVKYDRDLFNTSTEAISYSPSLDAEYTIGLGCGYAIIPNATYTHIWSYDLWSKSRYADFSVDSGILGLGLRGIIPLPVQAFNNDLELQPFFKHTTLYGAGRDSLGDDTIYDMGSDLGINLGEEDIFSQIRVGLAYMKADHLDGYRVNLGASF